MQIQIRSNILEVRRWLDDAQKKQVPFATVMAMTQTAKDVAWEEIGVMQRVFDRPTPYTINALQVKPATKSKLIASVEFKEFGGTPAKRFLNPEALGGPRSQKSHERLIAPLLKGYSYLVPARGVRLNKYGNLPAATLVRVLSQLRASSNSDANATGSKRSKGSRKAQAFFVNKKGNMVMQRRGKKKISPFLVGIKSPNYTKRFPFYETAEAVVRERLNINFEIAFQRAMATAR